MGGKRSATLIALAAVPMIREGDDLASVIVSALAASSEVLQPGDILVIAQKIFSKAEGRMVRLSNVVPSSTAAALAQEVRKDPRVVELILQESRKVVRHRPDLLIVEHRLGFVVANAGIDMSNVEHEGEDDTALLL